MYFADESYYYGYWVNDKQSKVGRMIYNDGDMYQGEWDNDLANGKG